jgi:hypothetical protein
MNARPEYFHLKHLKCLADKNKVYSLRFQLPSLQKRVVTTERECFTDGQGTGNIS